MVALLTLSSGRLSLEMDAAEVPRLAALIRQRYGAPEACVHPLAIAYRFAGCDFTFQDEWDDPCLISKSPAGDGVLRALHAELLNG